MSNENDDLLNKDEFCELVQHLTIEEILLIEYFIDSAWYKLIEQNETSQNLFKCRMCNVRVSGVKDLYIHLDCNHHKQRLRKVDELFHPNFTHSKWILVKSIENVVTVDEDIETSDQTVDQNNTERIVIEDNSNDDIVKADASSVNNFANLSDSSKKNTDIMSQPVISSKSEIEDSTLQIEKTQILEDLSNIKEDNTINKINTRASCEIVEESVKNHTNEAKSRVSFGSHKLPLIRSRINVRRSSELFGNLSNLNKHNDQNISIDDRNQKGDMLQINEKWCEHISKNRVVINPAALYVQNEQSKIDRSVKDSIVKFGAEGKASTPSIVSSQIEQSSTVENKSNIASSLDDGKIRGLLGVEYVIKILKTESDNCPRYECALCQLILNGLAMQKHLEGYEHRLKYCEKHFSTAVNHFRQYINLPEYEVYKVMAPILKQLAIAVEKHYGRNRPQECLESDYNWNRSKMLDKAISQYHFCEQYGPSFTHILDFQDIDILIAERHAYSSRNDIRSILFDKPLPRNKLHNQAYSNSSQNKNCNEETYTSTSGSCYISGVTDGNALDPVDDETHRRMVESFLKDTMKKSSSDQTDRSDKVNRSNKSNKRSSRKRRKSLQTSHRKSSVSPHNMNYSSKHGGDLPKRRSPLLPSPRKSIWCEYKAIVNKKLKTIDDRYSSYGNQLENHPKYKEEWQKFWKKRKDELIESGLDYRKYDFQSEWAQFFKIRYKELYSEDVESMKISVRKELFLPMTNDPNFLNDTKYYVNVSSGETPPKSSARLTLYDKKPQVITVLRLMTALEDDLGSLGPKIVNLLSKALQIEKLDPENVNNIILNDDNWSLIETAKEKFKGTVLAEIYEGSKQRALNKAVDEIENLLNCYESRRIKQTMPLGHIAQYHSSTNEMLQESSLFPTIPIISTMQATNKMPLSTSGNMIGNEFPATSAEQPSPYSLAQGHSLAQPASNVMEALRRTQQLLTQSTNVRNDITEPEAHNSFESLQSSMSPDKTDLLSVLSSILHVQGKSDLDNHSLNKLGAILNMIEKKKRENNIANSKKKLLSDMLMNLIKNDSNINSSTTELAQNTTSVTLGNKISNLNKNNEVNRNITNVLSQNANMMNSYISNERSAPLSGYNNSERYQNNYTTSASNSSQDKFSGENNLNDNNNILVQTATTATSSNLGQINSNACGINDTTNSHDNNNIMLGYQQRQQQYMQQQSQLQQSQFYVQGQKQQYQIPPQQYFPHSMYYNAYTTYKSGTNNIQQHSSTSNTNNVGDYTAYNQSFWRSY